MKKTLIMAIAAISLSSVNSFASGNSNFVIVSSINTGVVSSGTITELTVNGGKIRDNGTGEVKDFYHSGAQVEFIIGDAVSYRLITLPNGKPPVVVDIKKPS